MSKAKNRSSPKATLVTQTCPSSKSNSGANADGIRWLTVTILATFQKLLCHREPPSPRVARRGLLEFRRIRGCCGRGIAAAPSSAWAAESSPAIPSETPAAALAMAGFDIRSKSLRTDAQP